MSLLNSRTKLLAFSTWLFFSKGSPLNLLKSCVDLEEDFNSYLNWFKRSYYWVFVNLLRPSFKLKKNDLGFTLKETFWSVFELKYWHFNIFLSIKYAFLNFILLGMRVFPNAIRSKSIFKISSSHLEIGLSEPFSNL